MSGWRRIILGIVIVHMCIILFLMVGSVVMVGLETLSGEADLPLSSRALLFAVDWMQVIYLVVALSDVFAIWAICLGRPLARGWVAPLYVAAVLLSLAAHVAAVVIATRIGTFHDAAGNHVIVLDPSMWQGAALWGAIMAIPAVLTGGLVIVERLRRAAGVCRGCGYDLAGLPGRARCPECGRVAAGFPRSEHAGPAAIARATERSS